jgi:hypothetical protein
VLASPIGVVKPRQRLKEAYQQLGQLRNVRALICSPPANVVRNSGMLAASAKQCLQHRADCWRAGEVKVLIDLAFFATINHTGRQMFASARSR